MSDDVELLPITALVHDPKTSRAHSPRSQGSIVDSIHVAGFGRGIVIDEDNVIYAGNGAVEAAMEALGDRAKVLVIDQDVAALTVVKRTGLTDSQKVRLALDDNRAAEHSRFDHAVLADVKAEYKLDLKTFFTPLEWDAAVRPAAEHQPVMTASAGKKAVNRLKRANMLWIHPVAVPLTVDETKAFAAILDAMSDKFGSYAGAGTVLARAICEVVSEDDAVKAL